MTTSSSIRNRGVLTFVVFKPSFDRFVSLLGRILFASLLISLIWLPGLSMKSALAMPERSQEQIIDSAAKGDRLSAFIACLPKQLSQPSIKRALSEMGDDQLERIFNVKSNPKLSQAETELKSCLNSKGFAS
jgi:hypothetical protein